MLTKAEVQRLRSLRDKKHREALGLFVIEGEKVIGELLAAGFPLEAIYATEDSLVGRAGHPAEPGGNRVAESQPRFTGRDSPPSADRFISVTPAEMARISHFPTPSPLLAVGRIQRDPLPPGALERGLTLALDGVQDAGNVGTLLRLADWFALARVLLSPDCADVFHQKVINASMGSFARVQTHVVDLAPALSHLGVPILGCDLAGDDVHSLAPVSDAVIVIGSEGRGLSPAVAARVTQRVTIPRFGQAESLNAAVAAAIVCDNLRHPR